MDRPEQIKLDPFKSAKWDELTSGRSFKKSDIPTLVLLCEWYAVIDKCIDDITYSGEVQVAYENKMGDIKALPQLEIMKKASAEIRAINKQLGISDSYEEKPRANTPLQLVINRRANGNRAATA